MDFELDHKSVDGMAQRWDELLGLLMVSMSLSRQHLSHY